MADSTIRQAEFSSPETEEVAGYRQISRFAIFSLLFGLLSATSLIHPLLWVVPVIATVLAIAALRGMAANPELAGRPLALLGLILALLLGSWGATWILGRQAILNRQARQYAEQWFDLVRQGDYHRAHQLSLSYYERLPAGESLEEFYAEREIDFNQPEEVMEAGHLQLQSFLESEPIKTMVGAGDFRVTFASNGVILRESSLSTLIEQVFSVHFRQDDQPREMRVRMRMKRAVDGRRAFWEVSQLNEEK